MDGASTYQLYRHVLFPQLTPVALSALIIIGHMSMKMFDLIMCVSGPQWLTEVPVGLRLADAAHQRLRQGRRDLDLPAAAGRPRHRART